MAKEDVKAESKAAPKLDAKAAFEATCDAIAEHDNVKLIGPTLLMGETLGEENAVVKTSSSKKHCADLYRRKTSKFMIRFNGRDVFRTEALPIGKSKSIWLGARWSHEPEPEAK